MCDNTDFDNDFDDNSGSLADDYSDMGDQEAADWVSDDDD